MKSLWRTIKYLFFAHNPVQGYVVHIPHGVITVVLAVLVHWILAFLFGVGYIVFQYWQKYDGHPVDANDLAGWLLGMALAGIGYVIFF